jgi:membrane associated rhomboid family serine protease
MNTKEHVLLITTWALVAVIIAMLLMFIYAILDPAVDDGKVFEIIGPAFQTVVGGFIGLITGIKIGSDDDNK